jgi:hypothetical protein
MKNIPPELIYILLFVAFALFQYLVKRFFKRPQPEAQEEVPIAQDAPAPADEPLPEIWGRPTVAPVPVLAVRVAPALVVPAAIPRRYSAARSLLGTKRDLQRTIAIMTILGPCRAQEPADSR